MGVVPDFKKTTQLLEPVEVHAPHHCFCIAQNSDWHVLTPLVAWTLLKMSANTGMPKQGARRASNNDDDTIGVVGVLDSRSPVMWYAVLGSIILGTLWTRLHNLAEPAHVCWDEAHFGLFANWYINRKFFFDVHPPLGKMTIATAGYLTGYNGTFGFQVGDPYEDHHYLGMRVACSLLGSMIIPFCFLSVWKLTLSLTAASLAASFLMFDNGLATLSRFILLDPILMFFISGAVFTMTGFRAVFDQPFSKVWWQWLASLGFMLCCAISVKFVGLFVVLLAGIFTVQQLWDIMGEVSRPLIYTMKHFMARVLCLIAMPIAIYTMLFYIHLAILSKAGPGMALYSSLFQTTLEDSSLATVAMPSEVAYGAQITLKNQRVGSGYLHSHPILYPQGVGTVQQQQVTCYYGSSSETNDVWNVFIIKKWNEEPTNVHDSESPIDLVKSGDLVRLEHAFTRRNIHSHVEPAPMSQTQYQVSTCKSPPVVVCDNLQTFFAVTAIVLLQVTGYGHQGIGDENDIWQVEIVGGNHGDVLKTVVSKLLFYHVSAKCVLTCSGKQLPSWGLDQQEASCNPTWINRNSMWNVEEVYYPRLPNASFSHLAPGFFSRFVELHLVMFEINNAMKPKEGEVTSKPWEWPLNYKGQWFCNKHQRVYMLGNPFIFWTNLACLAFFPVLYVWAAFKEKRKHVESVQSKEARDKTVSACWWLFLGWALHYAPFWAMDRTAYFHHYFPASLFSSMLSGVLIPHMATACSNLLPKQLRPVFYHTVIGGVLAVAGGTFYLFSPLTYGIDEGLAQNSTSPLDHLRWLQSWEF